MPPETNSDTLTAESVAVQIIQDYPDLAKNYAAGDLTALGILEEKAVKLAAGRLNVQSVKDTLMRKLGASI